MAYDFHPDAQRELEQAVAYYDNIDSELADAFIDEVERTIERIENFPEAWPKISENTRRCRTVGFPYGIVYKVKEERILLVAVMHLQRQPNYWDDRI
ncbi:type II toxin-antitoxin system RelE/ParE family toxin [Argonema antarcticum]|uniref:type II toxin-antitoxin system RelE/ParE family toxin n=1 Tax=Argonema antarcticum TaxID=2942763 RepID=UPI0020120F57|nr:type II toxin-antitoxin system RelE/ParE family toxin [Argonema antarcticum]MCL1472431.1 type II toxin-antitoxin system RelE/ParE family toxin [Argonema antarcticum A004/B2]